MCITPVSAWIGKSYFSVASAVLFIRINSLLLDFGILVWISIGFLREAFDFNNFPSFPLNLYNILNPHSSFTLPLTTLSGFQHPRLQTVAFTTLKTLPKHWNPSNALSLSFSPPPKKEEKENKEITNYWQTQQEHCKPQLKISIII